MPKGMPNTESYQCQSGVRSSPRPVHESTWTGGRPVHSILQSHCAFCSVAHPASSAIITSHLVIVRDYLHHGETDKPALCRHEANNGQHPIQEVQLSKQRRLVPVETRGDANQCGVCA